MMNDANVETNPDEVVTWRVFAAVPVNATVRRVMQETQNAFVPRGWPLRWVDPKLAHITLKFYGDTNLPTVERLTSELGDIATQYARIPLHTTKLGVFPSWARPRVLWLGLDGDADRLKSLARDVEATARETTTSQRDKAKAFKAHITLARLRDGASVPSDFQPMVSFHQIEPVELVLDRLQLIRSVLGPKGPTYSTIAEWPLFSPELEQHEHG